MYLDRTVFTASTIQADAGLVSLPTWLTFVGGTTGVEQDCALARVRRNAVGEFKINKDATGASSIERVGVQRRFKSWKGARPSTWNIKLELPGACRRADRLLVADYVYRTIQTPTSKQTSSPRHC